MSELLGFELPTRCRARATTTALPFEASPEQHPADAAGPAEQTAGVGSGTGDDTVH